MEPNLFLTKLRTWGPNFLHYSFYLTFFLVPELFWTRIFFGPKYYGTSHFFDRKFLGLSNYLGLTKSSDMGKQFPLPSVSWSSVKGNCNLFTVSMISCAICLSTWKLSSFCCTWLSFLLLEQLTDCVQPKMVFWK